jgi:hypothetical protein
MKSKTNARSMRAIASVAERVGSGGLAAAYSTVRQRRGSGFKVTLPPRGMFPAERSVFAVWPVGIDMTREQMIRGSFSGAFVVGLAATGTLVACSVWAASAA